MPTVRLLIKGKVQGVFYRATAKDMAKKLGITGWIRNTEEGHVEAMANGSVEQIEQFVAWCRRGPSKAVVGEVLVEPSEDQDFEEFVVFRGK